jgi:antitoxin component YwqK of YwqJK toxin-antitoxin module
VDGYRQGLARTFHANGQKRTEGMYAADKQVGVWRSWRENGKALEEIQFADGLKEGPITRWQENGARELEGAYKADKKDGTFRYYDEEGELAKTEQYSAGRLVSTKKQAQLKKTK